MTVTIAELKPTKRRVIEAALHTLSEEGFAGTTAREIGKRGGFNQALIYYHFGSLEDLLIAALDAFSIERLARYRAALNSVATVTELVEVMTHLYQEDAASGRVAAVQEIIAGASSSAELGQKIVERLDPWTGFVQEVVERVLKGSPFEGVLPAKEAAYALVALYFGVETLSHLDRDRSKATALFDTGRRLAPLADSLLRGGDE